MYNLSLELIQYQNKDPIVDDIELIIGKLYKEIDNGIYKDNNALVNNSVYFKDLRTALVDRFNLNIVVDPVLHVLTPMAIIPFFSDYLQEYKSLMKLGPDAFSNIFKGIVNYSVLNNHIRKVISERKKMLSKIDNKKGYVDLKHARVGGYLSEVKHYLIIDLFTMKELELTPREVTATILHEIGHAFTGLEYHFKLEKVNSAIADILDNLNKNNPDKAEYIFKKTFGEKEFKELSVDISNPKERYDFYGHLALKYLDNIRTQMVHTKYDETNFELLADSFSARFGLYKELVSSLNKIYTRFGSLYTQDTVPTFMSVYGSLIMLLILPLLGSAGIAIFLIVLLGLFASDEEMIYDFPKERLERISNQLVNNLKMSNLPDEVEKDLIEQYVFINNIITKSENFETALTKIVDYISFSKRDAKYYIDLQRTIENNLNNILFVKSKQLKHS